jgi:L-iditol 2-dehydrogenase
MKAVVLHRPGDIRCEQVADPVPGPEEILVRVRAAGVCGSDIPRALKTGAYRSPLVLGHEFSGLVADAGRPVPGVSPGDRVTAYPLIPCRRCAQCRRGLFNLCEAYDYIGSRRDGAFAEYIAVPAANCLKLPENVGFETAALADPAAIALHALLRAGPCAGEAVAVVGAGTIGLLTVQWARRMGAGRVAAADVLEEKLRAAREVGADQAVDAGAGDAAPRLVEAAGEGGFGVVIEASGSPQGQALSVAIARRRGRVVFLGISHAALTLSEELVDRILRRELEVQGSWNSVAPDEWGRTLDAMGSGEIGAGPLITHRYRLEEAAEAFRMIGSGTEAYGKVMFLP